MWDKGKGKGDKDWEHSAQNSKLFFTAEWKAGKQGQTDHEKALKIAFSVQSLNMCLLSSIRKKGKTDTDTDTWYLY